MASKRRYFGIGMVVIGAILEMACTSYPDLERVDISSNVNGQILNLKNSGNSNIPADKANRVMHSGFLQSGSPEYGYYTLTLGYKYGKDDHTGYLIFSTLLGCFTFWVPHLFGVPIELTDFDLTAELDIKDANGTVIRAYTESETITQAGGVYYGDSTGKASPAYTRLIKKIQQRAAAEADSINQSLRMTGPIGGQSAEPDDARPSAPTQRTDMVVALEQASKEVMSGLQQKNLTRLKIAIVNVSSPDREQAEFIAGELEYLLVKNNFIIVDRRELDRIRREQNFQLSGDVDDDQVVSIGKFAGAGIVITGSITGSGSLRRLRLRALDTQTAEVRASSSKAF